MIYFKVSKIECINIYLNLLKNRFLNFVYMAAE